MIVVAALNVVGALISWRCIPDKLWERQSRQMAGGAVDHSSRSAR